ncbi:MULTISPECIES: MlaD family protein [Ponticaulis]|uniref:MlaD family protein n=1 Tax=Ponticaulis TaxID=1123044 RepID=UPI0003B58958|nr:MULTISPECIES: MlaD family protein [Ponticaulis]MBN04053.1 MCE family protein [Ponticaulis sp.]
METRASYALIGAAVLAAFAALIAFTIWLGKVEFDREFSEYDVVFEGAVNGLSEGGQVRYLGINVGEVVSLSLDRENTENVIARIRVDADTPVRTDSKAYLDFAGLTGVTFIQIRPGSPQADLMPGSAANPPILETEQTQLQEIFQGGQDLMANAQVTLSRLNAVLDAENAEAFRQTLGNIQRITNAFAEDEQLMQDAGAALRSLADAGEAVADAARGFGSLESDIQTALTDIADSADALIDDARRLIQTSETAVLETQESMRGVREAVEEPAEQTLQEIQRLTTDLRSLVRRLDRIAREVEQNPQSFIQGQPRPYRED